MPIITSTIPAPPLLIGIDDLEGYFGLDSKGELSKNLGGG